MYAFYGFFVAQPRELVLISHIFGLDAGLFAHAGSRRKTFPVSHAVHGVITGHDAVATAGTVTDPGGRHDTLTKLYYDPRATHLLAEARAVMEHARTVYPATGAPYVSARDG